MAAEFQENKKRLFPISCMVLFAILMHSVIVPLAGAQPNAPSISRKTITAVIPYDSPPTYFRNPKTLQAAGFAVEVMDEIALRAGLDVRYRFEHDWTAILNAVRTGTADLAPGMGITEERQRVLAFTVPIDTFPISLFVRSKDNSISGLRQGILVGVIHGSGAHEIIKNKHDNISMKTYESFAEGLFDLLAGHIDVFACPAPTLMQLARDSGVEDHIKIVGALLVEYNRGIAMRNDDATLFAKLNAVTEAFVGSPEYQRMYAKWYEKPRPFLSVSKNMLLNTALIVLAVAAIVFWRYISMAGLNRKLQQEMSDRARTEETLKEKNTMLQALIHAIPDQVFFKDAKGRYLLANKAMAETLGIGQDAFVGMTDDDLSPPEVAETCKRSDAEAIKKGGPICSEERYIDKNGETKFLDVVKAPICDMQGDLTGLVVVSRDVTDRRKTEETLRERDELLQQAVRVSQIGIFDHDQRTDTIYWSPQQRIIHGWSPDEPVTLQDFLNLIHPADRESISAAVRRAHDPAGDGIWDVEHRITRRDGSVRWLKERSQTFFEGEGTTRRPVRTVGAVLDITERKQAENEIWESRLMLKQVLDTIPQSIFWKDRDGVYIGCNKVFARAIGIDDADTIIGKTDFDLPWPREEAEAYRADDREVFTTSREKRHIIEPLQQADGSRLWIDTTKVPLVDKQGNVHGVLGVYDDITERKQAEEQIKRSLKEKEVLLKEIHHRVKNNMQVISSLLNLQAMGIRDTTTRAMFDEARNRVYSMALIHEKLYGATDLAHIDFKEYLNSLVSKIADTYKRHDVVFSVDMEPLTLDVNVGIPCGLIVNELVSNSLKYAFPDGRRGLVKVGINARNEGSYVLTVSDNGIGFPETVDFRNTKSLGLQLVTVLAGQIHGTVELSKAAGTTFSMNFPGTMEKN